MSSSSSSDGPILALIAALAVGCAMALASTSSDTGASRWVVSWGTAVQRPVAGTEDTGPNWSREGFADHSLRQVVRLTGGGSTLRIRLSNRYGSTPLKVAGATVGRSGGGALVWPDTIRPVTFGGAAAAVVPPGGELVSDAVEMETSPLEKLAVTLRFTEPTGPATFHRFTTATSYRARGNHLDDIGADAFTQTTNAWYYLSGVEVTPRGGDADRAVVAFGDSLIDGVGAAPEADSRFTDQLAERLVGDDRPMTVVNAGIAGGRLLNDSPCFGEKASARFQRDVLDRPGVRAVIVHLGANDLAFPQLDDACARPNPKVTAAQLIEGHRALIRAAHARGVKAIGVTIVPLKGALIPLWNSRAEKIRLKVNDWIRTGGEYDAVLDADRAMSDTHTPDRPRPGYVFQDGLHPNDAGYHAIATALDLNDL